MLVWAPEWKVFREAHRPLYTPCCIHLLAPEHYTCACLRSSLNNPLLEHLTPLFEQHRMRTCSIQCHLLVRKNLVVRAHARARTVLPWGSRPALYSSTDPT